MSMCGGDSTLGTPPASPLHRHRPIWEGADMRIESSVTSLSWIPSEAVKGMTKLPFEMGMAHYDPPPPDGLAPPDDLESLRAADRFRFANELRAWIEVDPAAYLQAPAPGRRRPTPRGPGHVRRDHRQ